MIANARAGQPRRGVVLSLPLTVGLLVLLALVAMAQLARTGQTLEEAAWDAGGAAAEEAATAALEEASWRLQRALTDPAEALYWHLRRELVRGHRPYLDISTDVDPKHLRARLADPALPPLFRSMRIDHFRAVFHVPLRAGNGEQLVDLDCGVRLDLAAHRVYRRACERRRYGVVHVSPPKPFDQMTLAIADHGFLRELPRIRNSWRRRILASNTLFERLAWTRAVLTASLPGRPTTAGVPLTGETRMLEGGVEVAFAPPFQSAKKPPRMPARLQIILTDRLSDRRRHDRAVDDTLSRMTSEERGWEEWRLVLNEPDAQVRLRLTGASARRGGPAWPQLPAGLVGTDAPGPDAVIFSLSPQVDLAEFDYEVRLRELAREHEAAMERAMEQVNELWVGYVERGPVTLSAGGLTQLEDSLERLFKQMHPGVLKLTRQLQELVAHAGRHARSGLSGSSLAANLARSSRRLRAFGLHVDDQTQLTDALAAYPVFNGHLSLSGKEPLELSAPRWAGKAVVSVRAERALVAERLTVRSLRRASRTADLAIVDAPVLHLGAEPVEAAVVVGDRLSLAGPAAITGNLLIKRLLPLKDRRPDEELHGRVTFDPLVTSGPLLERKSTAQEPENFGLDHLVVTLCPRGAARVVRRAPPAGEGG